MSNAWSTNGLMELEGVYECAIKWFGSVCEHCCMVALCVLSIALVIFIKSRPVCAVVCPNSRLPFKVNCGVICHGGLRASMLHSQSDRDKEFPHSFETFARLVTWQDIISIVRGGPRGMQDDVLGLVPSQAPTQLPSICSDPSCGELIDLPNRKRRPSFCLAVWLGQDVSPGGSGVPRGAFLRCIGADTLPKVAERRWFLQTYSGCPPPLLMPTLTVLQIMTSGKSNASVAAYRPTMRIYGKRGSVFRKMFNFHSLAWTVCREEEAHLDVHKQGKRSSSECPTLRTTRMAIKSSIHPQHRHAERDPNICRSARKPSPLNIGDERLDSAPEGSWLAGHTPSFVDGCQEGREALPRSRILWLSWSWLLVRAVTLGLSLSLALAGFEDGWVRAVCTGETGWILVERGMAGGRMVFPSGGAPGHVLLPLRGYHAVWRFATSCALVIKLRPFPHTQKDNPAKFGYMPRSCSNLLLFLYYMAGWEKFPHSILNYRPRDLYQPWRLVTYALLHQGLFEMSICILAQLVVALPLEIVHGSPRIGLIYMAGVFAGSSITSTIDPKAPLLGASGGTFALLSAHLGNIVMSTSHMEWVFRLPQLLTVLLLMSVEFGRAVWRRMLPPTSGVPVGPSFMAHGAGVVVGISLGLVVLRNFGQRLRDCSIFWATFGAYIIVTMAAVGCSFLC
uniref:uncharacterized protein n=1 Tax=Myxine glutinosa TaxID=7769 RepID=UPI00358EB8F5